MMPRTGPAPLLALLLLWGCSDDDPGQLADTGPADLAPDRGLDLRTTDLTPPDTTPPRPDGKLTLGAPCTADHHCSAGLRCETAEPGGLCTRTCQADAECGGGICAGGACRAKCNVRSPLDDCRSSYACRLEAGKAWCAADCNQKACTAPLTCDKKSGLCVNPKGGTLGAACGAGLGDCTGTPNGVCVSLGGISKAMCTLPCSPFTAPCPTDVPGATCAAGDVKGEYCIFTCDTKAPKCPHKAMTCKSVGSYALCLQP